MTMVERVASAIASALGNMDAENWMDESRAALQALRTPTDAMVEAAMHGRDGTLPPAVIRHVWETMVQAALDADS